MDKQKIEDIRKVVIEANPSIKDLVVGCRIIDFMKGQAVIVGIEKYENESDCYYQFYDKIPHPVINLSPYHNWDIIGREIRLVDILFTYQHFSRGVMMGVNQSGWFMFSDSCTPEKGKYQFTMADFDIIGIREANKHGRWNLLNDSLSSQSDETISFLWDLLIGRK